MISWRQWFLFDALSTGAAVFAAGLAVLILIYTVGWTSGERGRRPGLSIGIVLAGLLSIAALLARNLILLTVLWGALGPVMYLLIASPRTNAAGRTAKKALIIVGGADAAMLLGVAVLWRIAGRPGLTEFGMEALHLSLGGPGASLAYLCLLVAALAKAGAMPLHSWVADTAEHAPTPATALLPASLDKILGIYLIVRLNSAIFEPGGGMRSALMAIGSLTIVAAVMMALVQHDLKRLLGYHAVSQVGYMVLGLGAGGALGVAGALFHMYNNTLYKTCLFLGAGAVERRAGTTHLDRLGGMARRTPLVFAAFTIAALAIAGVPPLNGFASKWLIYQAVLEARVHCGGWWFVWLACAMFGSALTLASFLKLLHAVFLAPPAGSDSSWDASPERPTVWGPPLLLAAVCIVFGVLATSVVIPLLLAPAVGIEPSVIGLWQPGAATVALLLALLAGAVLTLFFGRGKPPREVDAFVGGERLEEPARFRVSGVDFYRTVEDLPVIRSIYAAAARKWFDVHDVGAKVVFGLSHGLGWLHNGFLARYLSWCLLGGLLLILFLKR